MDGQTGHSLNLAGEDDEEDSVPNWAGHNLCAGVRWRVKGKRRQPIQAAAAFIQIGRWNLLALW